MAVVQRQPLDATLTSHPQVVHVADDLADVASIATVVERVVERFGGIDTLVNNAGIMFERAVSEISAAEWDLMVAVNLRAPLFLAQAAAPHLAGRNGAIVNLVDIYAERPLPRHSVYCMAKAALAAATLALAQELAPLVRVNGVAPGAVLWPDDKDEAARKELVARTPLQRAGTPEDVAGAVLWLLRDARFVTGQIIRVDGGRSLSM